MEQRPQFCPQKYALFIIPLVTLILAVFSKIVAGPYWLGANSDPSYLYLFDFLYMADGHVPYFVDHPGIPLQVLGALVMKIATFGQTHQSMVEHVLLNPEYYLNLTYFAMLALYIFSILFLGFYAFRKTRNLIFAVLLQSTSLLFFTLKSYGSQYAALPIVANINSDTFMLPVINLFIAGLVRLYTGMNPEGDGSRSSGGIISAVLFGCICGLGIATKWTFASLVVAPFILLPGTLSRSLFIFSVIVSWHIVILPVFMRYGEMYRWILHILSGPGGVNIGPKYIHNLSGLIMDNSLLFCMAVLCATVWIKDTVSEKMQRAKGPRQSERNKNIVLNFLFALSVAVFVHFLFIAKRPGPHYMAPAIGMFCTFIGFLYLLNPVPSLVIKRRVAALSAAFIILLTLCACLYQVRLGATNMSDLSLSKRVYRQDNHCAVFGYYRSSSKTTALEWAHAAGYVQEYKEILNKLYPKALFYSKWHRTFHNFSKNVFLEQVVSAYGCAMLYGSPYDFDGFIETEVVDSAASEKAYRIKSTTLDEAHHSYLLAKELESRKLFKMAYIEAMRAKIFGRPGMDAFLKSLAERINK